MAWGEYPAEYNPKVHGPYDPARFYGKADTALANVKIGELSEWLGRRNLSVGGIAGGISRGFWRWQHKYMQPKKVGIAPFVQVTVASMIFFYALNYGKLKHHRNHKYHW
uniref:EOG090X0JXG n=1 Tax=Megafenestra aurita TaxID=2291010 RepID=A0A4Y7NJM7_9CRUS|nr:EOG090X0JXG [Megafenestra aurita]